MDTLNLSSVPAWIGRTQEAETLHTCLEAGRHVLLEGPVGVGKTHLVLSVLSERKQKVFRVDGDPRFSEQKITGWFDPPLVLSRGFQWDTFLAGPLVAAMQEGGALFINELNRLPEGTQNVLLPVLDERVLTLPKLGSLQARKEFVVIATQNPKEFVATSPLSEALLDRFEWMRLDYPPEQEEWDIVKQSLHDQAMHGFAVSDLLGLAAVRIVRATRQHPQIRRGASLRAALSLALITHHWIKKGKEDQEALLAAAFLTLPTRIELEPQFDSQDSLDQLQKKVIQECVQGRDAFCSEKGKTEKKKTFPLT